MTKQLFAFALTVAVLTGTIVPTFAQAKPEMIQGVDYDEYGGADALDNSGDNLESKFYKAPDFYNMVSDKQLTIIPKFKTMQQTTEWSCGNATSLMVLEHFNIKGFTEMKLAEIMGSSVDKDIEGSIPGSANNFHEYGSNVNQLYDFFNTQKDLKVLETSYVENPLEADLTSELDGITPADYGNFKPTFSSSSLYASENSDDRQAWVTDAKDAFFVKWLTDHLNVGRPIMVEWGDWDGHWQAIIGYDNNGTPGIGDDVLVFADPYDTSDHWQDGYYFYPLERWFYMWQDRKVAPKPYQLQPFIVIDKVVK